MRGRKLGSFCAFGARHAVPVRELGSFRIFGSWAGRLGLFCTFGVGAGSRVTGKESPSAMVIDQVPHRLYFSYWDKTYYYSSFFLVLFLSVRIVSCVICFTPSVVSGPRIPALRGLSRDRPGHTCSGGFKG